MRMQMKRFCAALVLPAVFFLSTPARARAASAELASAGVSGRSRILLSVPDLPRFREDLLKNEAAAPYVQALAGGWKLNVTTDAALCASTQPKQLSFAVCLKKADITAEELFPGVTEQRIDPAGAFAAESGLSEPAFLDLPLKKPVRLFTALLRRGEKHYLIGSTAGLEALQQMADAAGDEHLQSADVRMKIVIDPQALSAGMFMSTVPLEAELGVNFTGSGVVLPFRLNLPDLADSVLGLRRPFWKYGAEPQTPPQLLGSGRLEGIWHLSLNFIDEHKRLSELAGNPKISEIAAAVAKKAETVTGLSEQELLHVLRGSFTLGISGRMTVKDLGTLPGVYFHVSGLSEPQAAEAVKRLREKRIGAENYEIAAWKGFRLDGTVPLAVLYGSGGLLFLAMDKGEETGVPEVPYAADEIMAPQWHVFQLSMADLFRQLPAAALAEMYRKGMPESGAAGSADTAPALQDKGMISAETLPEALKSTAEAVTVAASLLHSLPSESKSTPRGNEKDVQELSDSLKSAVEGVNVGASLLKDESAPPAAPPKLRENNAVRPLPWQRLWDYAAAFENIFVENIDGRNGVIRLDINEKELARLLHRDFPPDELLGSLF